MSRVVGAVIAALGAAAYTTLTLLRFHQFALTSWDNAIFEQAVSRYAHLDAPIVDIKGPGFHILGDHFSPIDALIAPFYRIWPDARTILLAQVVLIAVSIYVIAVLAIRVCGIWWGSVVGVLYAVSFGLQSAVKADFHEVAFAAPLLAWAGAAYVERRWTAVIGWSLPLLLVKEDLGLTVAIIGGVLWLAGERRRGAVLAAIGVAGAALTVLVIIPAFATGGYAYTSTTGFALFDDPGRKFATVALTVGITGLAALLSPWVLVAIPTLAWRFAADNPYYWGTDWHYSLVLMPIVFIALIDAVERFDWPKFAIPAAAVVTGLTLVNSPLSELSTDDPARAATAREVVAAIPDGVSVEADIGLLTHLATGRTAYWTGTIGDTVTPDYVVFDQWSGLGSPENALVYAQTKYGGQWETVIDRDGYDLVCRVRGGSCS